MAEACHLCGQSVRLNGAGGGDSDGFRCADCDGVTCPDCKSIAVARADDYCQRCRG